VPGDNNPQEKVQQFVQELCTTLPAPVIQELCTALPAKAQMIGYPCIIYCIFNSCVQMVYCLHIGILLITVGLLWFPCLLAFLGKVGQDKSLGRGASSIFLQNKEILAYIV
jgi:hypothetical protein